MSGIGRTDLPAMQADDFVPWTAGQPAGERYELHGGRVVAMSPERWGHAILRTRIAFLLMQAVRAAGLPCDVATDAVAVRCDASSVFVPDILVRCGCPLAADTLEITDPMIVVEVLSAATASRDKGVKLAGYFSLPSLQHYLLISGDERRIVHHRRMTDNEFTTRIVGTDPVPLRPPGIILAGVFD
jgi:Uma2 family endonuclease